MRQHTAVNVPKANTFHCRLGDLSSPEQSRYTYLCFQTDKAENQTELYAFYDHCKLTSLHIHLINN